LSARVAALLVTPVKGLRAMGREAVRLDAGGVAENRRFLIVDEAARMVNGKRLGSLQAVTAEYSHPERTLVLRFPDGGEVGAEVRRAEPVEAAFYSRAIPGTLIEGPWSAALSEHAGTPLRLVESDLPCGAVDRGVAGTVSLVSRASVDRLAAAAGAGTALDARRLRMLVEIDGVAAHEEDGWLERPLRLGEAVVVLRGHVGRCAVTKRDPETGETDLDTLGALAGYRSDAATTEPLACGVYGEIVQPGTVRVGDAVG
jgi:uncharacterized protein YcbX